MVYPRLIDDDSTRVGAIAIRYEDRITIVASVIHKAGAIRRPGDVDNHFTEKHAGLAAAP